jgi:hypothetical protein
MDQHRNRPDDVQQDVDPRPEGERWTSEPDTVERRERERRGQPGQGGGITNHPVGEEVESQNRVPPRGETDDQNR